ncbi:MAG: gamma-glutamyl-gamma-aminobutyrate hydrolase family protein, partial [Ilumatobacteraceae bacterium]
MSRAPLIAVTGRCSDTADNVRGAAFSSGQGYSRAVAAAGGLPVIVPPIAARYEQLLDTMSRFDALLLHGGGDVDPRRYGQEPTAEQLYGIVQDHDDLEFALVDAALYLGLPVLAICRGIQVLNVALGGTLVQDLGTES